MKKTFLGAMLALSAAANAFILTGTVSNEQGEAVKGASVSLPGLGIANTTDGVGAFTLRDSEMGASINHVSKPGFVSVNNSVLSYLQSSSSPVLVQVFDAVGNRVLNKTFHGSGSVDLAGFIKAEGSYFARVKMGSAVESFRFTAKGSYNSAFENVTSQALKKEAAGETLQVVADGYDTLKIVLANLDTNVALTLKKGSANTQAGGDSETQYAFGYAMKNAPTPSKGCGRVSTLQKTKDVENGSRFEMNVAGLTREFFITLPKNYDNTKPYKILFANHCMGSNAEDFVHHYPDQDHPSPYYGQQALDTENNYIFVAPRGDTDGMPWRTGDDKDHQFFEALLNTMEENYCIDTSRVFVTGFSFGSMFSNSLAQTFQHRIRAVVTYAVADWNIYIPTNAGKPIAWMDVHGIDDGLCAYDRLNSSITRILKNNGPDGTDVSSEINQMERYTKDKGATHVCYNFKKVDPRFPVQVCTWNGGHQWTAFDSGNWQNTWVPAAVHKFFEQF